MPGRKATSAAEDRILVLAAPPLLAILERKKEAALSRLYRAYRDGADLKAITAEYVTLIDLIREVQTKVSNAEEGVP